MKLVPQILRWLKYWLAPIILSGLTVLYGAHAWWAVAAVFAVAAAGLVGMTRQLWRERPPQG